jgi:lincosamide nucleotidyltransferase A/C/D/E
MFSAENVIFIYQLLENHGIRSWLTGGWGIDALLGEITRPHKDLDIFVLVDDVVRLNGLLAEQGFEFAKLWSENLSTTDSSGNRVDTGYVLRHPDGRELDVHAFRFDGLGDGIPAWQVEEGFVLAPDDLSGAGSVTGLQVRCQSAENQMICHTGYVIPEHQWSDLDALHETLGVEFPAEILKQRN